MKKNSYEPSTNNELQPFVDDGWSLPVEPERGRKGPVLVRSTFMSQIDDGWVLPPEPARLALVTEPAVETQPAAAIVDDRINLNTATHHELQTLPGVGQGKASRIVSWRERNAGFSTIDDLAKVSGFGARSVAKLADRLTV